VIGRTLGQYRILARLGRGGMGEVFLARDMRLDRQVAVKTLPDSLEANVTARRRLLSEAKAAAAIDHPYVCKIYDVGEADGLAYIAMEYVEGETLASRVAAGAIAVETALRLALEIVEALVRAHAVGFVHRDLKLANLMLGPDGHVKVMDFGLAKRLSLPEESATMSQARLTETGMVVGTLDYASPEQLRGDAVDQRTDLFSLGVVLYHLLAGSNPFGRPTPLESAAAILHEALPPLTSQRPDTSDACERIVRKLLIKDRGARYQTAVAVRDDLRELISSSQPPSTASARVPAASTIASIVAMPTRVIGPESSAFLADAIPNLISTALLSIGAVGIRRPPSAVEVERVSGDLDRVAAIYGVDAYVSSSAIAIEGNLLLDVQIVDARTQNLLWSCNIEGTIERYRDVIRQAAEGIVSALKLPAGDLFRSTGAAPANAAVEMLVQRGTYYFNLFLNRGRAGDFERALAAFREAFDLDQSRADAAAGIASLHQARLFTGATPADVLPDAELWARRALDLDSCSSKAWGVLSHVTAVRDPTNYQAQLEYALKAAAFGPREARAHTEVAMPLARNSWQLALAAAQEASRLDPLVIEGPVYEAACLAALGREAEAIARCDAALAIEPDMLLGRLTKALMLAHLGRVDESSALLALLEPMVAARQLHPTWYAIVQQYVAFNRAAQSGDAAAMESPAVFLARMARGEELFPRWTGITQAVSWVFAQYGRREEAVQIMTARRRAGYIDPYDHLVLNPHMAVLRGDPRIEEQIVIARERFVEMVAVLNRARARNEVPTYLAATLDELTRRLPEPDTIA
jgi:non-specific serine/threonine protein kinase